MRIALFPLTVVAALIAGCANPPLTGVSESLIAETSEAVFSYRFAAGSHRIEEAGRIRKSLTGLNLAHDDILVVSLPVGANGPATARRRQELRALLAVFPSRLHFVEDKGLAGSSLPSDRGIIRVVRAVSVASSCSIKSREISCANARNLAAMIANPEDVMFPERGSRYFPAAGEISAPVAISGVAP